MKKRIAALLAAGMIGVACAQAAGTIRVTINGQALQMQLADTAAAKELEEMIGSGTMTVKLQSYGGFEAFGHLPSGLTREDTQLTAAPGDVVLYGGDSIVFFYGSNDWAYTRLGKLQADPAQLRGLLSGGNASAVLSK